MIIAIIVVIIIIIIIIIIIGCMTFVNRDGCLFCLFLHFCCCLFVFFVLFFFVVVCLLCFALFVFVLFCFPVFFISLLFIFRPRLAIFTPCHSGYKLFKEGILRQTRRYGNFICLYLLLLFSSRQHYGVDSKILNCFAPRCDFFHLR